MNACKAELIKEATLSHTYRNCALNMTSQENELVSIYLLLHI